MTLAINTYQVTNNKIELAALQDIRKDASSSKNYQTFPDKEFRLVKDIAGNDMLVLKKVNFASRLKEFFGIDDKRRTTERMAAMQVLQNSITLLGKQ